MSVASKLALAAAVTFTVSTITYVHLSQKRAREVSCIWSVSYLLLITQFCNFWVNFCFVTSMSEWA